MQTVSTAFSVKRDTGLIPGGDKMSSVPNVPVMKAIVVFIEHRQATRRIRIIRGGMIGGRPVGIVKDRVSFWRFELEAPIRQTGKDYFRRPHTWSGPNRPGRIWD